MNGCKILRLDPARRRQAMPPEAPAHSAMISDGVMHFPAQRHKADVHDCEEMHERRRLRQSRSA